MQTWPIYLTSNDSCQRYEQKCVFCTYWPCDLDLWRFVLKNIPAPEYMSMNFCAKFEHSNCIWARAMVRTNTHTYPPAYRRQRMPYLHCLTEAQVTIDDMSEGGGHANRHIVMANIHILQYNLVENANKSALTVKRNRPGTVLLHMEVPHLSRLLISGIWRKL